MKAIIMAGGEGVRLRPLTCDCPKPMIPLMNRPVMQYAVELLRDHGIRDIAVTLGYQPEAITDYFGDGADFGVSLRWYKESTPLGTAGSVRNVSDFLDETFVVLSGDGITDLDLTAVLSLHRRQKALATLVLHREAQPAEYGLVSIDDEGRVLGFVEKPAPGDGAGQNVNTGIYILEPEILQHIPPKQPYDFGSELFPRLVREGAKFFGHVTDHYWCDVGDLGAYLRAHADAMDGRIRRPGLSLRPGGVAILPGAFVDRTAVLEAPCLIGSGAKIHAGARIGAYTVVGTNAVVGANADLKRTILWTNAQAAPRAQLRGCVLSAHAVAGADCQIYEECVLGTGSSAGEGAILIPGVRIWPGKCAAPGVRISENLVWGSCHSESFAAGTLALSSPSQASRAAQCFIHALQPQELVIGRAPGAVADALWHAAAAGAMAAGVQVVDAGLCTLPQLRHAQQLLRADGALLLTDNRMIPLNASGARLSAAEQRKVNTLNARHDYAAPFTGLTRPVLRAASADLTYIADAAHGYRARTEGVPPVALHAQCPHLLSLAERAFLRAGLSVRAGWEDDLRQLAPGEVGICLDEYGETAVFSDEHGALSDGEQHLLRAWTSLEEGERELLLPMWATRAVNDLVQRKDARAVYLPGDASVWMNALASGTPRQFLLWFDGIHAALRILSALNQRRMTLAEWRQSMPTVYRRSRTVNVPPSECGRILEEFSRKERRTELGGGLRFLREDGWAWISPDERHPVFRIVTESVNAETARELCSFCESELKRLAAPDCPSPEYRKNSRS